MTASADSDGSVWSPPRGIAIEDRVAIDAPAHVVWPYISDIAGWHRWNPVYPESSGTAAMNETIAVTVALPGMKPQRATATIRQCSAPHALVFGTKVLGGLMHATRYFLIEERGADACSLLNGEIFGGIVAPLAVKKLGPPVREGIVGAGGRLKALAEAEWRDRGVDPTT